MLPAEQHTLARGRAPWRSRRTPDDWIATIAWLQALMLLLYAAAIGVVAWATADLDALLCFDGTEPACTAPPEPPWFAAPEAIWSGIAVGAAVAALGLSRRNLRGRSSRRATLAAIAVTWIAVAAFTVAA